MEKQNRNGCINYGDVHQSIRWKKLFIKTETVYRPVNVNHLIQQQTTG
ncbi:putative regulator [Escherichia coli DEC3C]|nr:putative regulator [Escherichia coli DEC3C]